MREVFEDRTFRKLFFSNLFSGFGQGMTMIGVSWHLVETTGSAKLLGSTMLVSSIFVFLIGPFIGTWIDRFSRKAILQLEQAGGFTVLALMAMWGFGGAYQGWMLMLIFLATTFILQLHYPALSAFVQETFDRKQYNQINSLLEVENQTALVLAGACSGLLLEPVGLHVLLLLNALTYLIAFVMLLGIDYVFTVEKQAEKDVRTPWGESLRQGWLYLRERRGFMIFGVSALVPFLTVTLVNLLNPVFVSQTLSEDVSIFSFGEVAYSVGAMAAGILFAWISRIGGAFSSMVFYYLLMVLAFVLTVAVPKAWMFVLMSAFIGWCNVSTRLIRQNVYMEVLPNRFMGRVMSFFQSIGTLLRMLLLSLFTVMIDTTGVEGGYFVLAGLLLVAALGIIVSMRHLSS
ncbi:MFS transporter [Brevibacillus humidisoli]|uniref:MFS transporter n=1 Tax=Brevibacillus humidisoli TaxID=2895522 RepID=UPI001E432DDC|nr:MFS transporter [Brevibacillus humidisoli]UFJ39732.1 MFS transporter [Brevibacillus humidisoli]